MELNATATRHARGAWPNHVTGGEMTHSATGSLTVDGKSYNFDVSRVTVRRPAESGVDYSIAIYNPGSARELTSAKHDSIKSAIVQAFKRKVQAMSADSTPRGEDWTIPTPAPLAVAVKGIESREGESRPNMWLELTEGEKREATERGFPRGGDIRYFIRKGYKDGEWMLSRWTRLPSPGKPRTEADDKAEDLSQIAQGEEAPIPALTLDDIAAHIGLRQRELSEKHGYGDTATEDSLDYESRVLADIARVLRRHQL